MLEAAYAEARKNQASATDEAALVERLGYEVVLVPDSSWNIKVTTPEDLSLAELIAARERA
jgi:2-C-methyl-D-erythritol 4-phosphate cytidylyltransferase